MALQKGVALVAEHALGEPLDLRELCCGIRSLYHLFVSYCFISCDILKICLFLLFCLTPFLKNVWGENNTTSKFPKLVFFVLLCLFSPFQNRLVVRQHFLPHLQDASSHPCNFGREFGVVDFAPKQKPQALAMPLACNTQVEGVQCAIHKALDREMVHTKRVNTRNIVHEGRTCYASGFHKPEEPQSGRQSHRLQIMNRHNRASNHQTISRFQAESMTMSRLDSPAPWPSLQQLERLYQFETI